MLSGRGQVDGGGGRERPPVEPIAGVVVWNSGSSACSGK